MEESSSTANPVARVPNEGAAVQIVNFKTLPSGQSQLTLEKAAFREILLVVGERPVFLLSIAGASRQGKSFLMNIIRQFLEGLVNGETDPFAAMTKLERLSGFHTENRNVRGTIGFWLWSKPFIFKQSNGNEIAVLLMDTQGVFDKYSTEREWSMIVGLSLLTSSCVIYNLFRNLLEDNLKVLHTFMEFGMKALEADHSATSVFHKLLILIRDWGFPNDNAYGAVGGSQFLQSQLRVEPGISMPDPVRQVRETLHTVFEEIECFLMPRPGSAAEQNDFEGSLSQLKLEFLKNTKAFLNNLFIVDDLRPLSIGGHQVKGTDLLSIFSKYIELFNSQSTLTASSIYEVTSEVAQCKITEEYVSSVMQHVEDCIAKRGFLTLAEMKHEYQKSCKQALARFKLKHQQLQPVTLGRYSQMLISQLQTIPNQMSAKNLETKTQFVSNLRESCKTSFSSKIEVALRGITWSSLDLEEILTRCRKEVIQELELGDRDETFFAEIIPEIDSEIEELCKAFRRNNTAKLESINFNCQSLFDSLLKFYDRKMRLLVPENEVHTPEMLLKSHRLCEEEMLEEFCRLTNFDNDKLKEKAINELKAITKDRVSKLIDVIQVLREDSASQASEVVTQTVEKYCSLMNEYVRGSPTDQELDKQHRFLKGEAHGITIDILKIVKDPAEVERIVALLDEKLCESFESFKSQLQDARHHYASKCQSELDTILGAYQANMKTFIETLPCPSQEQFVQQAKVMQNISVQTVENLEWMSANDKPRFCEEVKSRLNGVQNAVENDYKRIFVAVEKRCAENLQECTEEYKLTLKQAITKEKDGMSVPKLLQISKPLSNNIRFRCETEWKKILSKPVVLNWLDQLVSEMRRIDLELTREVEKSYGLLMSEIQALMQEYYEDYISQVDEKLEGQSDLSKLEEVHNRTKPKVEREFKRQMKNCYSSFAETSQVMEMLHDQIQLAYEQKMEQLKEAQLIQKNSKIELNIVRQASIDDYRKYLTTRKTTLTSEKEFLPVHAEAVTRATKHFRQSLQNINGISVKELNEEEGQLESILEKELENQVKEWSSYNKKIDEKTKIFMQGVMKAYEDKMSEIKIKSVFLSSTELEEIHKQLVSQGMEEIRRAPKPLNTDALVYERKLTEDLNKLYECYANQNGNNRRTQESTIRLSIEKHKQDYSKWLASQRDPKPMLQEERAHHVRAIQQSCLDLNLQDRTATEFLLQFTSETIAALDASEQEWEKTEPTEAELELAVINSRKIYELEMGTKITRQTPLLHMKVLRRIHDTSVQKARKEFQGRVKQTETAKKRFEEALELAFRRHRDENDTKAADAGEIAVGIDLGTTYSCVAVYRNQNVEIIPDRNNHKPTVPSYVLFESKDKFVVGHSAKEQSCIYPETTVYDSKRLIGRRFNDKEVQDDMKLWPFKITNDGSNRPKVALHEDSFFPEEISGKILSQLKKSAEQQLGHEVKKAVITIPAYFTEAQKRATRAAADFAGLEVLELLSEPTAAAIAYKIHYNDDASRNIFVYDLGGGTFDVSILSCKMDKMVVKGISGNNHLGGQDFDSALVNHCLAEFNRMHNINIEAEENQSVKDACKRRIRNRCELAKIDLSKCEKVKITLEVLYKSKDLDIEITRDQFTEMIEAKLQETIALCKEAMRRADFTPADISEVVLVGGSSRIPKVEELLKELFSSGPYCVPVHMTLNPDEVVARGAAYRAAMLSGARERELGRLKFTSVTPFSLGIEVRGERFSEIIPRNTQVPCKRTETYVTSEDYVTKILFKIFEGEDKVSTNNNLLGEFKLRGIPSAKQGAEKLDVTMELDDEGLLNVTATCRSTGGKNDIKIESILAGLSSAEIEEHKSRHEADGG